MGDIKVTSVALEVTHPEGSATVVIRDPRSADERVYVAGNLPTALVEQALRELGFERSAGAVSSAAGVPSSSRLPSSPLSVTSAELASAPAASAPEDAADLLEELASAVLRAGRHQPTSTVDELLERAWSAVRGRVPMARVLARLEEGLAPGAPGAAAGLALAALGELVVALRADSGELRQELLGRSEALEASQWVEIGRRRERGGVGWETRLLCETGSGQLLREEGPLGDRRLSRGFVGRCLAVTLGRRVLGVSPGRAQILHYEYEPAASPEQLEAVEAFAARTPPAVPANHLELVAVPRPVWLRVERLAVEQNRCFLETGEARLPLHDGPLAGAVGAPWTGALGALLEKHERSDGVRALAGSLELRVSGDAARLVFAPWAGLVNEPAGLALIALSP
jgi:hypothetical protein